VRIAPSHYATGAAPARVKRSPVSVTRHLAPPLKGLSVFAKTAGTADEMTAPILSNWIVEEDRITVRPGSKLLLTLPETKAIQTLIPYYGTTQDLGLAVQDKVYNASGVVLASGFTSGNWNWTSFSNLSDTEYTVACNGSQGVWAWDGLANPPSGTIAVTRLSKTNPAKITVAPPTFPSLRPATP
jgi:hypothetical protein